VQTSTEHGLQRERLAGQPVCGRRIYRARADTRLFGPQDFSFASLDDGKMRAGAGED
jgi:hypothetical protein